MVNSPSIRPYLLGGGSFAGGTLGSHDDTAMAIGVAGPITP